MSLPFLPRSSPLKPALVSAMTRMTPAGSLNCALNVTGDESASRVSHTRLAVESCTFMNFHVCKGFPFKPVCRRANAQNAPCVQFCACDVIRVFIFFDVSGFTIRLHSCKLPWLISCNPFLVYCISDTMGFTCFTYKWLLVLVFQILKQL